jgi:hypothetical protein
MSRSTDGLRSVPDCTERSGGGQGGRARGELGQDPLPGLAVAPLILPSGSVPSRGLVMGPFIIFEEITSPLAADPDESAGPSVTAADQTARRLGSDAGPDPGRDRMGEK